MPCLPERRRPRQVIVYGQLDHQRGEDRGGDADEIEGEQGHHAGDPASGLQPEQE
jgi:hypothetical protein